MVPEGDEAQFSIRTNDGEATYQWQYSSDNGINWRNFSTNHPTAKTADFTLKAKAGYDGFQIRCKVTSSSGITLTSEAAVLSVEAFAIISQPQDTTVKAGEDALFVIGVNRQDVTYQWEYSRDNGINWRNFSSKHPTAKTAAFTLKAAAG